jgi:DUF971 family protein
MLCQVSPLTGIRRPGPPSSTILGPMTASTDNAGRGPRPTQLKLHKASRRLEVAFDDGQHFELPAEYLRVFSPSAEVRGHGSGPMILVVDKDQVGISRIEPVGNYAVRLIFDDGHDTGLYTWKVLRELGEDHAVNWQAYINRLAEAGQARKGEPVTYRANSPGGEA